MSSFQKSSSKSSSSSASAPMGQSGPAPQVGGSNQAAIEEMNAQQNGQGNAAHDESPILGAVAAANKNR